MGKEFHKTRVAFVPNSEESQSTNRAANGQAAVRTLFAHACRLGLEGIVSKRKDSCYRSGRSPDWLKSKNPASPAAKRDAEGFDWGR